MYLYVKNKHIVLDSDKIICQLFTAGPCDGEYGTEKLIELSLISDK